ncbi:hypothetical protein Sjap_022539 [Stephania japonica]|uniref:Fibronectin type III-like domain-containing protein n=1 Tax=Stephania japonica TaxID=461633 RepID=A0AAP0ES68_9MAGN
MPPKWNSPLYLLLFIQILAIPSNSQPQFPCKPPEHHTHPFCNTSLPIPTRAQSLLSLLTIPEKITQLSDHASPIPRLGLPAYEWWSESLHGVATNGPGVSFSGPIRSATLFPQVLLSAATFNASLWYSIASAIAVEARAMYNAGQAGLTFWAPSVNLFRDPRWGRGQETPGEDPFVAAAYAVEYVKGLQRDSVMMGGGDGKLMLSACCKHFTGYDLEKWRGFTRYTFDAVISEQDLEDTYQPPFKSCIQQGKASCLMCSYNRVNGIPACARQDLLQEVRTKWGFNGYITSDCDAVATIFEYQGYVQSPEQAVAVAFNSGLFDGDPAKGKYGKLGPQNVCSPEHTKLALEAARQGIVLLKNEKSFLPLNRNSIASLAVIGPLANDSLQLGGGYSGIPCNSWSFLEGFESFVEKVSYTAGCIDVPCRSSDGFKEAVHIAKEADVVIVVAGLDLSQETEDLDRVSLLLPGKQMELVSAVAVASQRPLVLVLTGGGPIDVSFADADSRIASIIWVGYPGEGGAQALAEIIFGDYNPGGRLPMTWYPESFTSVPMNDMSMRADPYCNYPGRTYRFYTGETVYRFGHGLSYSNYTHKFLSVPHKLMFEAQISTSPVKNMLYQTREELAYIPIDEVSSSCDSLIFEAQISVTNTGDMDGSHVVMLFSRAPRLFKGVPEKQLIGFTRVQTTSRRSTQTSIKVEPCKHLSVVNENGHPVLPLGYHKLTLEGVDHFVFIEMNATRAAFES